MSLFESGTPVWYAKLGIPEPVPCEYVAPVKTDTGGYSTMHIVRFGAGNLMEVSSAHLYTEEQVAIDKISKDKIDQIQDLCNVYCIKSTLTKRTTR